MTTIQVRIECQPEDPSAAQSPLIIGSFVQVDTEDEEFRHTLHGLVEITLQNATTDPEVIAGEWLASQGWELGECGPEWFDTTNADGTYLFTTGTATMFESGRTA